MSFEIKKLPEICEIKTGKYDANHASKTGKFRFYTCANNYSMCDTHSFSGPCVIVPGNGDIGLVFYYDGMFEAYQRTYVLQNIKINPRYLYYHMLYKWRFVNSGKQFGSTVKYVRMANFTSYEIPVATIHEQERIVNRIEEMFSQLDAGVETLKKTKAQLTVYRQAVLTEAFEGNLTGSKPTYIAELGKYIETPRYGTSKKCDYSRNDSSTAVYRIPNIDYNSGRISHEDIKYADFESRELDGITLKKGDILIIRSNGSASLVGRASMINELDLGGTFAGYLMRLRVKDKNELLPQFLLLYLQSHMARVYIENKAKSTSGVHNINSTEISQLLIPIYERHDQESIVDAIENRLSVCDSIEQTVDAALQQADALRQSILKQAFEGEL